MMTDDEPKVDIRKRYTVIEAARVLGVSRNTIYNWINSRIFQPGDIGFRKPYGQGILIKALALSRVWHSEKRYEPPSLGDESYITNVKSCKLKEAQKKGISFDDVISFEALKTHKKRRA